MNGPRLNHFWHYIFDLNNLKATCKVRTLANQTRNKCLEVILTEREKLKIETIKVSNNEEELELDEVTIQFYGECCSCSRKSTCRTVKCTCFKDNKKCNSLCHTEATFNCKNWQLYNVMHNWLSSLCWKWKTSLKAN